MGYAAVSATSISGNSNSGTVFDTAHLISQGGLSTGYVSGVTDAATFSTTHDDSFDEWVSPAQSLPAFVAFDMGSAVSLTAFLYWGSSFSGAGGQQDVKDFDLFADTDMDPTNGLGVLLGSFSAADSSGNVNTHEMERFDFSQTTTQFIHMRINNTHSTNPNPGFSEAAFIGTESAPVPEPSTLALLSLGTLGLCGRRWRRRQDPA